MSSDARLGALADLDLHGCSAVQIVGIHAVAPRGHLDYSVSSVVISLSSLVRPPS
jgi:hypothetical protein